MHTIVKLAGALADETRLRILQDLLEEEATVSDIGARLALAQPRISTHLKILHEAGLVSVEAVGRQRTYRVDAQRISQLLVAFRALAPHEPQLSPRSTQAAREVQRNSALRQARTCYGHLAGVVGVQLLDELRKRNWLVPAQANGRPQYDLTPEGVRALTRRGIDLDGVRDTRRLFAYGCLDWTERRPHLGGALGAAILRALKEAGLIRHKATSRVVTLLRPLDEWLDARSPKKREALKL